MLGVIAVGIPRSETDNFITEVGSVPLSLEAFFEMLVEYLRAKRVYWVTVRVYGVVMYSGTVVALPTNPLGAL